MALLSLFMVFMTKTREERVTGGNLIYGRVSHKSVRNNVAR